MHSGIATMQDSAELGQAHHLANVPRIAIQAFCETSEVASMIETSARDRRMDKVHLKVQMGGAHAAAEVYRTAATPNLIILEYAQGDGRKLLASLDELAESCDSGTKVVVIGHVNDVVLYRDLLRRGISDYLIAPISPIDFIRAVSELYNAPGADPVGRTIAVIGAKGGVGASTISHNLAWAISRGLATSTVIADLDLPFGTAGLDFNQDPPQGIAEAVFSPERLDAAFLDRLLSKCSEQLSLLAAPATLDRLYDFGETSFDAVIDILRASTPCIVLDMPHQWTAWSRRMLIGADDIVIVAAPDLANLRNAKVLMDNLRHARINDRRPKLVLNMQGMPKRPEISAVEFAKALDCDAAAVFPFDPQLFGTAANNGQMIAEVQANGKITDNFQELARMLVGKGETKKASKSLLAPLLSRLKAKA
ncbi:pilus assembly protein [Alsobacter metallidurans]|uniref:Pilus assembly protein n=1 Tax=Alsobacter metallidurans TaxID=340221 RepID=A0A917MI43_9HYPH|nr:CtpF protein [Alsobacter metallidurans]GGH08573.1 pilus assembly protein [Alsobacter metallidurans]